MAEKKDKESKHAVVPRNLFRQIAKGDLVTIHDGTVQRKGHAVGREYGNWVLVLEHNKGTALATKENAVAVSKPKKLGQPPVAGQRLIYDDGRPDRRVKGEVLQVHPRSMLVQFENRWEPNLIHFNDPEWMDYITFPGEGGQPYTDGEAVAESHRREQS